MTRVACGWFGLLGVCLCLVGVLYLLTPEFMPYHASALQSSWPDLPPNEQGLILGLMKGLGAGAWTAGFAIVYMAAMTLRRSGPTFRLLLPIVSVSYSTLLCYATWHVSSNTPGNPPLGLNALCVVVALLATVLLLSDRKPTGVET